MAAKRESFKAIAKPRDQTLVEYLKVGEAESDRRAIFVELVEHHGEALVEEARHKAAALGFRSPTAGEEAVNNAFIRLVEGLDSCWQADRPFLHRFRGEIWNELRHQRAKTAKLRSRFPSLGEEDAKQMASEVDPEQLYQSSEELRRIFAYIERGARSAQQRRLAKAWKLSKLGYEWAEVKAMIAWPGTRESLRVSVSRFSSQLKSRIQMQAG